MAKRMASTAVKQGAAALDRLRPPAPGVVVLIYHRVGGASGLQLDLPAGLFEEQMAALAEEGCVVDLDAALARLAGAPGAGDPGGPGPVVITFDDGTADFAEVAVPVLARYGLPATLYLATAFVEEARPFPGGGRPLSWSALADAVAAAPVTVGSHTHTHALLDRVGARQAEDELDRSTGLIGERLGLDAHHFAYPKAVAGSPEADAAVRARFRSAALAGTRPNPVGATDPHALGRSPIQAGDGMRWFRAKRAGGLGLEDRLRSLANRRRYASATT